MWICLHRLTTAKGCQCACLLHNQAVVHKGSPVQKWERNGLHRYSQVNCPTDLSMVKSVIHHPPKTHKHEMETVVLRVFCASQSANHKGCSTIAPLMLRRKLTNALHQMDRKVDCWRMIKTLKWLFNKNRSTYYRLRYFIRIIVHAVIHFMQQCSAAISKR